MNHLYAQWYVNQRQQDLLREAEAARLASIAKRQRAGRPGWSAGLPRSIGRIRLILRHGVV